MKKKFSAVLFGGLAFMASCSTTEDSNAGRCSCSIPASFCGVFSLYSSYLLETAEWEKGWREPSPESRKTTACAEYDLQANLRQSLSRIKALHTTNAMLSRKIQTLEERKRSIVKSQDVYRMNKFNDVVSHLIRDVSCREKLVREDMLHSLAAIGLAQKESKFLRERRALEKNVQTMREQLETLNVSKQALAGLIF